MRKKNVQNMGDNRLDKYKVEKTCDIQIEQEPDQVKKQEKYNQYVKQITPTYPLPLNMLKAFLIGGCICLVGQILTNAGLRAELDLMAARTWTSILLVLISVILTGLNLYGPLAQFGGAGALVPITGFANGVASSAHEYVAEGQVYGIGAQIFNIAGPVILYGIFTSWVLGVIYWIGKCLGVA